MSRLLMVFCFCWLFVGVSHAKSVREVNYTSSHPPGTIVISNSDKRLFYVMENNRAIAYDIAVGKPSEQ